MIVFLFRSNSTLVGMTTNIFHNLIMAKEENVATGCFEKKKKYRSVL